MPNPKILVLDIETKPIEAYVWGLRDQNLQEEQIIRDWAIFSWAAKWLGDPPSKVMYMDNRSAKDPCNDKILLPPLIKLIDACDVLVTQNGKSFDAKKINARIAEHKLKPPSSYQHADTLLISRKHFSFTSHRLSYLSSHLNEKYVKLRHERYPGFSLWIACMNRDMRAWADLKTYNIHDVLATEEVYNRLAPWDSSFNSALFTGDNKCKCGSTSFRRNGFKYTAAGKYQRFECLECGHETRSRQNLITNTRVPVVR